MSEEQLINKRDTGLDIDVYCCECEKLCALSNTKEIAGQHFCEQCYNDQIKARKLCGMMCYNRLKETP